MAGDPRPASGNSTRITRVSTRQTAPGSTRITPRKEAPVQPAPVQPEPAVIRASTRVSARLPAEKPPSGKSQRLAPADSSAGVPARSVDHPPAGRDARATNPAAPAPSRGSTRVSARLSAEPPAAAEKPQTGKSQRLTPEGGTGVPARQKESDADGRGRPSHRGSARISTRTSAQISPPSAEAPEKAPAAASNRVSARQTARISTRAAAPVAVAEPPPLAEGADGTPLADGAPLPRHTRLAFKLLGLVIVAVAVWMLAYSLRAGRPVDWTDEEDFTDGLQQARQDLSDAGDKTLEVTGGVVAWVSDSVGNLFKSKPVEATPVAKPREEEPRRIVERTPPAAAAPKRPAPRAPLPGPYLEAEAEYRAGQDVYAKTDPMGKHDQIQRYVLQAMPHYEKCLDLLEICRKKGARGGEIDKLEQNAAKRLMDCRRRIELH